MELLKESLKLTNFVEYEGFRLDKNKKPAKFQCLNCDPDFPDQIDWFWLENECPNFMPSHWERHLCKCQILHICRSKRNYLGNSLKMDELRVENKMSGEQKSRIKTSIELINKLIEAIKDLKDNDEYYAKRVEIADNLTCFKDEEDTSTVWQLLFCCKNKSEAEFYLNLIKLEQPNI